MFVQQIDSKWWAVELPDEKDAEFLLDKYNPNHDNKFFGLYIKHSATGDIRYYDIHWGMYTDKATTDMIQQNRTFFAWLPKFTLLNPSTNQPDPSGTGLPDGTEFTLGSMAVNGKTRPMRPVTQSPLSYNRAKQGRPPYSITLQSDKGTEYAIPVVQFGQHVLARWALLDDITLHDLKHNYLL